MVDVGKIRELLSTARKAPWAEVATSVREVEFGEWHEDSADAELALALVNSAESMLSEIEAGRELRRKVWEVVDLMDPEWFVWRNALCAEYDAAVTKE